eukprot:313476_1
MVSIESNDDTSMFINNNYITMGISRGQLAIRNINGDGTNTVDATEITYFDLRCDNKQDLCGNIGNLLLNDTNIVTIDIGESVNFSSNINVSDAHVFTMTIDAGAYVKDMTLDAEYTGIVSINISGMTNGGNTINAANAG